MEEAWAQGEHLSNASDPIQKEWGEGNLNDSLTSRVNQWWLALGELIDVKSRKKRKNGKKGPVYPPIIQWGLIGRVMLGVKGQYSCGWALHSNHIIDSLLYVEVKCELAKVELEEAGKKLKEFSAGNYSLARSQLFLWLIRLINSVDWWERDETLC